MPTLRREFLGVSVEELDASFITPFWTARQRDLEDRQPGDMTVEDWADLNGLSLRGARNSLEALRRRKEVVQLSVINPKTRRPVMVYRPVEDAKDTAAREGLLPAKAGRQSPDAPRSRSAVAPARKSTKGRQ